MSRETRPILQAETRYVFKYLSPYISADLSRQERAAILVEHYAFMKERVDRDFFQKIVHSRLELWRQVVGEHTYRICLTFPRIYHYEGDLALVFEADQIDIYTLVFTVGLGIHANRSPGHALYIGRVQGKPSALDPIRSATKHCRDVAPPALLLAAVEGVASALNIGHLIGVGAASHPGPGNRDRPGGLAPVYDEFWIAAGGLPLERNMYALPMPASPKPIQAVQRRHRQRAQRKREYRALVTEQVSRVLRDNPWRSDTGGWTANVAQQ